MSGTFQKAKKAEGVSAEILRTFVDQMKSVAKYPENLVKLSVHARVIARGDTTFEAPLPQARKPIQRPSKPHSERPSGPNRPHNRPPPDWRAP